MCGSLTPYSWLTHDIQKYPDSCLQIVKRDSAQKKVVSLPELVISSCSPTVQVASKTYTVKCTQTVSYSSASCNFLSICVCIVIVAIACSTWELGSNPQIGQQHLATTCQCWQQADVNRLFGIHDSASASNDNMQGLKVIPAWKSVREPTSKGTWVWRRHHDCSSKSWYWFWLKARFDWSG